MRLLYTGAKGNSLTLAGLQPDPLGTARGAAHGHDCKRLGQLDRVAYGADCGQRHTGPGPGLSQCQPPRRRQEGYEYCSVPPW